MNSQTASPKNNIEISNDLSPPRHGGDLATAMSLYGGDPHQWLDLSTGISPWAYPIPKIDETVWRELPNTVTELLSAAAKYYGCSDSVIYPAPGSQLAIRLIPKLIASPISVGIPTIGYQEHAYSWTQSTHTVVRYSDFEELSRLAKLRKINSAVVINPNNPSCETVSKESLLSLSQNLNGILLVDEAFADLDATHSLSSIDSLSSINSLSHTNNLNAQDQLGNNIIVLRSLGKFFGLAGARIGFVISRHDIAKQLNDLLSPWSISAASLHIAQQALSNTRWQATQKRKIVTQSHELNKQLNQHLIKIFKTDFTLQTQGLFSTITGPHKPLARLHNRLAERRIWTRIGDAHQNQDGELRNWLRLSLPGDNFNQFSNALYALN